MKNKIRFLAVMLMSMMLSVNPLWGTEEVYKTSKFGSAADSGTSNNYTSTFKTTTNGFSVNVTNGNTNNTNWALVKFGSKNDASTGYIITDAAIDKAVTKVSINISAITTAYITSITLYSGSSATTCTTNLGTFTKSTGLQTVTIASPAANKFYKIEFVCTKAKDNGPISVTQVDFYKGSSAITWKVNDEPYTEGNPTTEVDNGSKVSTLPTAPTTDCGGKVFVGWTATENYTDATDAPSDLFNTAAGAPTVSGNVTYYAVFAEASAGGTPTWIKMEASEISESGIYALIEPGGKAFTGSISSGHGAMTSNAFSFTNGVATSAPSGTLELELTAYDVNGGGYAFDIYNAENGYLYAKAASSGNLAWSKTALTEDDYWIYYSGDSNFEFWHNTNTKSYYASLRAYNSTTFRTYADNSTTGSAIAFAKKSDGTTYSNYTTSCVSTYTLVYADRKK